MLFDEATADIPFPVEGVDVVRAFTRQRPLTTPQAMNVRAFDPGTDRARGGARPGLATYATGPALAIQDITVFISEGATAGGVIPAGPGIAGTVGANTITVANPGTQVTTVNRAASVSNTATNSAAGQTLTWTAQGLPAGMSINASTGTISGTPAYVQTCTVVITATDGTSSSGSATFTWIITTTASQRTQYVMFAAAGNIYEVLGTSYTLVGGPSLSATPAVVFCTPLQQQLFYSDGSSYLFFAPWANTIKTWTATQGTLPTDTAGNTCTLLCTWNGRVVMSGLAKDPANWFMSAQLNPFNWDYSPPTQVATQAVAGNNSPAGTLGDQVRCLLPYNDQILIFGCSHSIWQLAGDPMSGGQLTVVSTSLGMQWGRPYCIDPYGQIYFVGSDRGVYKYVPGSLPVRISQAINRQLQNLVPYNPAAPTNSQVIFRLVWDTYNQGLWVFATPTSANPATHFFWEERTNAWWPQSFANTNCDPLAATVLGADTADQQIVLLGGRDGLIRQTSDTATDDTGTPITSSVVLGPIGTKRTLEGMEYIMLKDLLATLGANSGVVYWSAYVGASAEDALASTPIASGTFPFAGRNPAAYIRRAGFEIYLKLTGAGPWSLDRLQGTIARISGKVPWRQYAPSAPAAVAATPAPITTPPPPPAPAPTATISASPTVVNYGGSTVITWSTTNAVAAYLNGQAVALNGAQTFTGLAASTTFTISAVGAPNTAAGSASVTVPVNPTATITASPTLFAPYGGLVTLTLSALNGVSATLASTQIAYGPATATLNGTQAFYLASAAIPAIYNVPPNPVTFTYTVTGAPGTTPSVTTLNVYMAPIGNLIMPPPLARHTPAGSGIHANRRKAPHSIVSFKALSSHPAITFVQKQTNTAASATIITAAFVSNVTANNLVVVAVQFYAGAATPSLSVTDTLGNTYSSAVSVSVATGTIAQIFYTKSGATGSNTVTVTATSSGNLALGVMEYSGPTTWTLDNTTTNTGTTQTSGSTALPTTAQPPELLVSMVGTASSSITTITNTSGWTDRFNSGGTVDIQDVVSGSQSTAAPSWAFSGGSGSATYNAVAASFY